MLQASDSSRKRTVLHTDQVMQLVGRSKAVVSSSYAMYCSCFHLDGHQHMKGFIVNSKPNLMFIHFDSIDDAGHAHQWGSQEYYNAVKVRKYLHANSTSPPNIPKSFDPWTEIFSRY